MVDEPGCDCEGKSLCLDTSFEAYKECRGSLELRKKEGSEFT